MRPEVSPPRLADMAALASTSCDCAKGRNAVVATQLSLTAAADDIERFRPIHYLGSKLRLLDSIRGAVESVSGSGPLCDLFAGSGTVSRAFAGTRRITSVD